MREVLKAISYVTSEHGILAISQPLSPEVGYLMPSGTVESGELPASAALREAEEETGLGGLRLGQSLGVVRYDMRPIRREVQVRHFFKLEASAKTSRTWNHYEAHPSSGGPAIPFELIWLPMDAVAAETFSVGHGQMIPSLTRQAGWIRHPAAAALLEKARLGRLRRTQTFSEALAAAEVFVPALGTETSVVTQAQIAQIFCQMSICTQRNDTASLSLVDSLAHKMLATRPSSRILTLSSSDCKRYDLPMFESPIFIVNESTLNLAAESSSPPVQVALNVLDRMGYREYIDSIGICCIVGQCDRLEPNRSYTLSATPGTIYVTGIDSQVRMMEQLLHESIHNWLNDVMYALGENWNDERAWWSPWKNEERPTYGMLHAAYVFAVLIEFFQICSNDDRLNEFDRAYAAERLVSESIVLTSVIDTLPDVLAVVKDKVLQMFISLKLNASLNIASEVLRGTQK